jgi:hypothetical protein
MHKQWTSAIPEELTDGISAARNFNGVYEQKIEGGAHVVP